MTGNVLRILSVEDSAIDAELCWRELERSGLKFKAEQVWSLHDYENALHNFAPELILCDFSLPGAFDGMTALDIARQRSPDIPFIFVSGTIGEDRAVEALKRGATDYVLKEHMDRLVPVVQRALQEARERTTLRLAEGALRESEARFRQMAENIRDVFFLVEAENQRLLYVSPAYEDIWGTSRASLYDDPRVWRNAIHPADKARIETSFAKRLRDGQTQLEYRIVRPDGSIRWIGDRAFPIRDAAGHLQRIAGIASDITERKLAEKRIERLNHIYAVLSGINTLIVRAGDRDELLRETCHIAIDPGRFRMAWIGMLENDSDDTTVRPVAYAAAMDDSLDLPVDLSTNLSAGDNLLVTQAIRARKPLVINDVDADPRAHALHQALESRGIRSFAIIPLQQGDRIIGVLALHAGDVAAFDDEEMRLINELAGDISFALDYISKAERLTYIAYYDALTGIPNRTLFTERLNHKLRTAKYNDSMVALILYDIKRFRLINESFGRQAGDALLREIALRTDANWPNPDSVARINADCFAGTLTNFKDEAAVAHGIDNGLHATTGAPYMIGNEELRISTTAGIALFPADGHDAETLFKNAEAALKQAKVSGERYLFYQPSMNARVADTLLLENKLRKALENEEFVLHYQPKLGLATGTLDGLEALIRWNDPDNGLVGPGTFIPLLEETGMILSVGEWAIHRALADHARWRAQGLQPPRIAVNVSAIQLRKADFVETVCQAIQAVGSTADVLELEITETLIMTDITENIGKLEALREMRVDISIDDFGTGYSSLSYLARLPVQWLKIDRSFISTMCESEVSMNIVSTIISLAHSLKLKVIAEGVETKEQAHLLSELCCDEAQGYLYSRPVPFEQISALLSKAR